MDIVSICAVAIITTVAASSLKKYSYEISVLVGISGSVIIFIHVLMNIAPFINEIKLLTEISNLPDEYGIILIKTVGICALCRFTADCCRDGGQQAAASKVEFAAKLSIILISLPMFENILSFALSLLGHKND